MVKLCGEKLLVHPEEDINKITDPKKLKWLWDNFRVAPEDSK